VRQLQQARRVVEKALRARIRGEKRKEWWLKAREQWKNGYTFRFTRGEIKSFKKGREYCEGPYRQ
jgi:hypothetical protein